MDSCHRCIWEIILFTVINITALLITLLTILKNSRSLQVEEASNVIKRVLPDYSDQFVLKLIKKEGASDVFIKVSCNT